MWMTISGAASRMALVNASASRMSPMIERMPSATRATSNRLGVVGAASA